MACKACLFSRPQNKSMSGFGQRSALTLRITTQSVGPRALWGRDGGGGERFGNEMGYDIRLVACGFSGGVCRPAAGGLPCGVGPEALCFLPGHRCTRGAPVFPLTHPYFLNAVMVERTKDSVT